MTLHCSRTDHRGLSALPRTTEKGTRQAAGFLYPIAQ